MKPGTRHKATLAALALLNGEAEGLTRKAVELALAGDVTALRLCLERLVPPCREAPVRLNHPRLQTRGGRGSCIVLPASGGGPWRGDTWARRAGADWLASTTAAVQLTEIQEHLRGLQEALGLMPGPG